MFPIWVGSFLAKPIVKRLGPIAVVALAITAVLLAVYMTGRSHGKAKWHSKYETVVTERDTANDTATHNGNEVIRLEAAINMQNEAYAKLERDGREQLNNIKSVHDAVLRRQATVTQRAVDAARADALRSRVEVLTAAETCHEAWLEVTQ